MKKLLTLAVTAAACLAMAGPASAATCRQGDPPITVSATTSCAMAGNIVNEYMNGHYGQRSGAMRVYSPVTHRTYAIRLSMRGRPGYGGILTATGPNGIRAPFGVW